jgi:hypothetical protein
LEGSFVDSSFHKDDNETLGFRFLLKMLCLSNPLWRM